eukprot:105914_1
MMNDQKKKNKTKTPTVEAELSKTLNIKWADARDLASYARGKLGIVPGDKIAEKERHQSLLQAAVEANAQCPKKKRPAAPKEPELSYEERIRKEKIEKSAKKMARGGYRRVYY